MSDHVLLNLLNVLRKNDKMQGMPSILSFFCDEFNKFNNTGARMLDSINHMTLKPFVSALYRHNINIGTQGAGIASGKNI